MPISTQVCLELVVCIVRCSRMQMASPVASLLEHHIHCVVPSSIEDEEFEQTGRLTPCASASACPELVGTWVQNMFRNLVPDFLTCPQLVGTWVQNISRNSVPDFRQAAGGISSI